MLNPVEYWRSGQGLAHITPPGNAAPEGEGFAELLQQVIDGVSVLDFGCGIGRLAGWFSPDTYIGVDICPAAIEQARQAHPDHRFMLTDERDVLPGASAVLAHTVLLHVCDEALPRVIARFNSARVVVSEILGIRWRRSGNPPVFNRERIDYVEAFRPRYRLRSSRSHPYPHYRGEVLSILEFERC